MRATFKPYICRRLYWFLSYYIDCSDQRRGSVNPSGRTFQYLYSLDVAFVHRQIQGEMPCLRVTHVDSVYQYSNLVGGASPHADICLNAHAAPLANVHAYGIFQKVIHRMRRGSLYCNAVQHCHHPGRAIQVDRHAAAADDQLFQLIIPGFL